MVIKIKATALIRQCYGNNNLKTFNYVVELNDGLTPSWRKGTSVRLLWLRFPLLGVTYLIFSFLRSGNGAKRGVEFRHSIRNAS